MKVDICEVKNANLNQVFIIESGKKYTEFEDVPSSVKCDTLVNCKWDVHFDGITSITEASAEYQRIVMDLIQRNGFYYGLPNVTDGSLPDE